MKIYQWELIAEALTCYKATLIQRRDKTTREDYAEYLKQLIKEVNQLIEITENKINRYVSGDE